MPSATPPKPTLSSKQVYTVRDVSGRRFTMIMHQRRAIVAFETEAQALLCSNIIESHYLATGGWPEIDISPEAVDQPAIYATGLINVPGAVRTEGEDLQQLLRACSTNFVDVLLVTHFVNNEKDFSIGADVIREHHDLSTLKRMLNSSLRLD